MISEIIEYLKEYFSRSSIYIDENETNENKLRLGCEKVNVYLNIYWVDVYYLLGDSESFKSIKAFFDSNGTINRMSRVETLFGYIAYENFYPIHNKKMKLWGYKLNSFSDRYIQGFYKDNYAEFSIETQLIREKDFNCKFFIEDVEVNISYPSDIYRLIFQSTRPLRTFELQWEHELTISLRKKHNSKLKLVEVENYLQQALFILNLYYPDSFVFGSTDELYHNQSIQFVRGNIGQIAKSNDIEPIIYYNEGVNSTEETSFYYFYKVLEFYFQKNIEYMIKKLILTSTANNDVDNAVKKIVELKINSKEIKLKHLLSNENIFYNICDHLEIYLGVGKDINYYANKIYLHRNKLMHSEDEDRRLPKLLEMDNNDDLSIKHWNELIKEIAYVCINYFSYNNQLTIKNIS